MGANFNIGTGNDNNVFKATELQQMLNEVTGHDGVDIKKEVQEVAPILMSANALNVNTVAPAFKKGGDNETAKVPSLETPSSRQADLESTVEILIGDGENLYAQSHKKRLESLLKRMEKQHTDTLKRVNESIDISREMAAAQKRNRIFGWVMTAISALVLVVSSVATLGAAAGPLAIGLAVAATAFSAASLALNIKQQIEASNGTAEKKVEDEAKEIQKNEHPDWSLAKCKVEAQNRISKRSFIISMILTIASIVCSLGSSLATNAVRKAGEKAAEEALKKTTETLTETMQKQISEAGLKAVRSKTLVNFGGTAQTWLKGTQFTLQGVQLGGGLASTTFSFIDLNKSEEATRLEAAVHRLQKVLEWLRGMIEDEQTAIAEAVEQLQKGLSGLADLLELNTDSTKQVFMKLGAAV